MSDRYKLVRSYYEGAHGNCRTLERGLTLEEAQAHCKRTDTHSHIVRGGQWDKRTRRMGRWFDGYERD